MESTNDTSHITNMIKNDHLAVFIGSGACKSAGLPLAGELRSEIARRLEIQIKNESTLEELLQEIKEKQGREAFAIIRDTISDKIHPPRGYESLAALIKNGFIKVVFTTNYDTLLENSLHKIGQEFIVVSTKNEYDNFTISLEPQKPVIFKLHGSIDKENSMQGAWDEVQEFSKEKCRILLPYFVNYGFLFVGYACADKDVISTIKQSLKNRRDRKSYVITPNSSQTINQMLNMLNSNTNHLAMSSDDFFEQILRKLMKINKKTEVPEGLIEAKAKKILSSEEVKNAMKYSPEELKRQDIERLENRIQKIMNNWASPLEKNGLTIYRQVRRQRDWEGKNNNISKQFIESSSRSRIENLEFVTEFEFEIRVMAKNEPVMPIVFSIFDVFMEQKDMIVVWTLFISDAFPWGEKLDGDHLKLPWSEDGFLKLESWITKKLKLTVNNMDKAGSGKIIRR